MDIELIRRKDVILMSNDVREEKKKSFVFERPEDWIVQAPGTVGLSRRPLPSIPDGGRLASARELLAANQGRPFPWGDLPEAKQPSRLWREHRIGVGGLCHDKWFVTADGRIGGAMNVPTTLPGSLRSCLLYDGGPGDGADNEGYAVLLPVGEDSRDVYRCLQFHAAEHVVADRGAIIVSPVGRDGQVFLGFIGKCQGCPNAEDISFKQAAQALVKKFGNRFTPELYPEWKNWRV